MGKILRVIRERFNDKLSSGQTGEAYLKGQIAVIAKMNITESTLKEFDKYHSSESLILNSICVLLAAQSELGQAIMNKTDTDFIERYPQFGSVTRPEFDKLFLHWKYVQVCLNVIKMRASSNRCRILNICGRLEGTKKVYLRGSTRGSPTEMRMRIYDKESGTVRKVRAFRARPKRQIDGPNESDQAGKKRKPGKAVDPPIKKRKSNAVLNESDQAGKKRKPRKPVTAAVQNIRLEAKLAKYCAGSGKPAGKPRGKQASSNARVTLVPSTDSACNTASINNSLSQSRQAVVETNDCGTCSDDDDDSYLTFEPNACQSYNWGCEANTRTSSDDDDDDSYLTFEPNAGQSYYWGCEASTRTSSDDDDDSHPISEPNSVQSDSDGYPDGWEHNIDDFDMSVLDDI